MPSARVLIRQSGLRGPKGDQGPAGTGGGGGGSGDVAGDTHAATGKTTPVTADEFPLADSVASYVLKKVTFGNLKATIIAALTKSSVGLGSVDNTADTAKPVSTAQQTAIDAKLDISSLGSSVESAFPNLTLTWGYNTGSSSWPTIPTALATDAGIAHHFVGGDVSHVPPTVSGTRTWDRPT